MKAQLTTWIFSLLFLAPCMLFADETITVTATDSDISENLDLKAVATLFGEAKNLEEFEQKLNDSETHISNLDLNGDGQVDYLRVVETTDKNAHLIVLQAVLAKDIYQDVASIYVEKDEATQQVTVQIIGDEYLYGTNYVIEPVYIYTPVIYDWFWGPSWYCWHSPYYWGYYPSYWHVYDCWIIHNYRHHIYDFHHHHPYCSYRTRPQPAPHYATMRPKVSRYDYATLHPDRGFAQRNADRTNVRNARDLHPQRATRDASTARGTVSPSRSRTFDSSYGVGTTRVNGATTSTRSAAANTSVSRRAEAANSVQGSRSASATTNSRTVTTPATTTRSATTTQASRTSGTASRNATSATVSRSTGTSSTVRSGNTSTSATRNSSVSRTSSSRNNVQSTTRSTSSVSRSTGTPVSRSSSVSNSTRSSSSSSSRVGSSYSGGSNRGSVSGGGSRSTGGSSSRSGSTRR